MESASYLVENVLGLLVVGTNGVGRHPMALHHEVIILLLNGVNNEISCGN